MLVLSRKIGETLVFDHGWITVKVIGIEGGRVKIGVITSDDVTVNRGEIEERWAAGVAAQKAKELQSGDNKGKGQQS